MAQAKGCLSLLGALLDFYRKPDRKYTLLKNDEQKRDTSKILGVRSIVWSLSTLAVIFACCLGADACFDNLQTLLGGTKTEVPLPFSSILVGVMCVAGAVIMFVQGFLSSLFHMIFQYKLNKQPIRHVALFVYLVCLVGSVVLVYLILYA